MPYLYPMCPFHGIAVTRLLARDTRREPLRVDAILLIDLCLERGCEGSIFVFSLLGGQSLRIIHLANHCTDVLRLGVGRGRTCIRRCFTPLAFPFRCQLKPYYAVTIRVTHRGHVCCLGLIWSPA